MSATVLRPIAIASLVWNVAFQAQSVRCWSPSRRKSFIEPPHTCSMRPVLSGARSELFSQRSWRGDPPNDSASQLASVFKPTCHSERSEESRATVTLSRRRTHGFLVPLLMNAGMDLAKQAKEAKQAFVSFASFARPTPRLVVNRSCQGNSWFLSVSE